VRNDSNRFISCSAHKLRVNEVDGIRLGEQMLSRFRAECQEITVKAGVIKCAEMPWVPGDHVKPKAKVGPPEGGHYG
jgi:hypothetical protein